MKTVTPKPKTAEYAGVYNLRLTFADGKSGILDLQNQLWGSARPRPRLPPVASTVLPRMSK